MSTVADNLQSIQTRISRAAQRAGRDPESVTLVAVSKRQEPEKIRAAISAGQQVFGENYLQDAAAKIPEFPDFLRWHFIGHIQTNKAARVAELFDLVETVDRLKLARALDKHCRVLNKILPVYIQVNIGREAQKSGVSPEDLPQLLTAVGDLANLRVEGLMAMPPYSPDPEEARPYFRAMADLADGLREKGLLGNQREGFALSMGMSGDFEVAIEEGATVVRVGTALFGTRD